MPSNRLSLAMLLFAATAAMLAGTTHAQCDSASACPSTITDADTCSSKCLSRSYIGGNWKSTPTKAECICLLANGKQQVYCCNAVDPGPATTTSAPGPDPQIDCLTLNITDSASCQLACGPTATSVSYSTQNGVGECVCSDNKLCGLTPPISPGVIVLIAGGVLVLLVGVALAVFFVRRFLKQQQLQSHGADYNAMS